MRLVLLLEVVSEVCASSVTLSVLAGLPELCALELLVVDLDLLLLLVQGSTVTTFTLASSSKTRVRLTEGPRLSSNSSNSMSQPVQ